MTSLSYPPRPVPPEEGRSSEGPRQRARGERRAAGRSNPFGAQHTADPFAPKTKSGQLPKVDPLMPTRQAEALKRQWEEKKGVEEAQRRALEHKRRVAQEEAQRRVEEHARARAEQRAREKAELDYQRWSSQQAAREEEESRARRHQHQLQAERERQRAAEESRRRAEEARLAEWRQDQLYAREQQLLQSRATHANVEAKRRPESFIPPPDAWRSSPPSAPPYGMSPQRVTNVPSEASALASRSYPEQGMFEPPLQHVSARPVEVKPEVSQREAELLRLVKLQVEAISQLKDSLEELSSRQQLLERRHEAHDRSTQAIQQAGHATPTQAPTLKPQSEVMGSAEGKRRTEVAQGVAQEGSAASPPPPPVARLSAAHDGLSSLQSPKGIFARLSSGLKKLVSGLEEDPWSDLVTHAPSALPPTTAEGEGQESPEQEGRQPTNAHQELTPAERTSSERLVSDEPQADVDEQRSLSDSGARLSPPIIQFSQGAFEETVGGVTISKAPQIGQDGPLYPILLQQAQLIKQHSVTLQTLGQRVHQLEGSLKSQSTDLKAQLKKLAKQVERAELKADGVQRHKARIKSHQRRISQLEVMIEGLEGKIAGFEERLSSDGQGPATDLRVSPEPGVGDYTTIQEALNDAPVGAYIGIMPGLYTEPLEITKPVKLIGLGKPNEILIQVPVYSAIMVNRMGGQYEEAISHTQELEARKRLQQHTTHVAEPTRSSGLLKWFKQKLWNEPEVDDRGLFEVETGSDEVSIVGVSINSVTEEVGGTPTEYPTISVRSGHLRLEKCEVRAENGVGVLVEGENAQVTLRACRVVNTRGSALRLRTRALATLSGSRLMKSKESGIDAQGFTSVRLMDCEVSNHQRIGVHVGFKSQLIAYQSVISGNSFEGVWMNNQSTGSIRSCDMRGNARGPYDISPDCKVELGGNKP